MISKVKGKTEISLNPTDAPRRFLNSLFCCRSFLSLKGPQVMRPDIHLPSQGQPRDYRRFRLFGKCRRREWALFHCSSEAAATVCDQHSFFCSLYGRLSLGQPGVQETQQWHAAFIAHAVPTQQGTPGKSLQTERLCEILLNSLLQCLEIVFSTINGKQVFNQFTSNG